MDQNQLQSVKIGDKASDHPNDKAIKWRHIFDWGFWNESPLASIVVFFIGGILLSSLTKFPGGNPKQVWYVAAGVWLVFGVIVFWVASGIVAHMEGRELLTTQELEDREASYRGNIQSRLDALEAGVVDTTRQLEERKPRSLTTKESGVIVNVAKQFPSQKARVHAMMNDPEAAQYAQDFVRAFRDAGWQSQTEHSWVGLDFYNVQIAIAGDAPLEAAKAATSLQEILVDLGLSNSKVPVNKVGQGNIVGEGTINVRIGPRPSKSPPLRNAILPAAPQ